MCSLGGLRLVAACAVPEGGGDAWSAECAQAVDWLDAEPIVMTMLNLSRDDRLRLLKFVCTFAWTDLQVTEEERALVGEMMKHYGFDDAERKLVSGWLAVPPPVDEVDPTDIPAKHRQLFYTSVKKMVEADGRIVPGEQESLETFQELLHDW